LEDKAVLEADRSLQGVPASQKSKESIQIAEGEGLSTKLSTLVRTLGLRITTTQWTALSMGLRRPVLMVAPATAVTKQSGDGGGEGHRPGAEG
jgi:hypothetical protein